MKLIDFSPGEKYLVTYSSHEPSNPRDANVSASVVFLFLVFLICFCGFYFWYILTLLFTPDFFFLFFIFQRVVINIFDVRTGKIMRDFKGSADDFAVGGAGGVTGVSWPVFKYYFFLILYLSIAHAQVF